MRAPARSYYLGVAVAAYTILLLLYGIGALGIIGSGGPGDLMYVGAAAVGLVGAALARFRPRGTAMALGVAALTTLLAGVVAIAAGVHDDASRVDVVGITGMYTCLYGLSAWLFWRAAGQNALVESRGPDRVE